MQLSWTPVEDFPMTFQVGLIGADSIVLASDLLHTSIEETSGFRTEYKAAKIRVPNRRFAYCCAGRVGGWADKTIERFLGMENVFTQEALTVASQVTWQEASKRDKENPYWRGSILLVEHTETTDTLWHMNANCPPSPCPVLDR